MRPLALPGRGSLVVDLADDRVLGRADRGDGGDRGRDGLLTAVGMDRLQRSRRLGHRQLRSCSEKLATASK